jgi:hypothetical protein
MGGGGLTSPPPSGAPPAPSARLICLFHLNLAFSSLDVEARPAVLERCYWPVLRLPERTGFPVAIEATGWTLERIGELDPAWLAEARRLLEAGLLELVGSGRSQCAAPLLPADANAWNLRLGLEDYERLLGVRPRVALVNEQAYAPGLVELYAEAGFEAIVADWENAARSHPRWSTALRRLPQRAVGGAASLPVLWSESLVFQRFQRFAHGEMTTERWLEWVHERAGDGPAALMLYANDAEVFDHRPGRFAAEPPPGEGEWERIADGLSALARGPLEPVLPSRALDLLAAAGADTPLRLESAAHPVPVKKQDKYNIGRWAVSGRDDIALNTRCARLHRRLRDEAVTEPAAWRELCDLWASDLRTHITKDRWDAAQTWLARIEEREGISPPPAAPELPVGHDPAAGVERDGALLRVRSGPLTVELNPRRGLAVDGFRDDRVGPSSLLGTVEHGYYEPIELGADWYSANLVQEAPGRHKVTDLAPTDPTWARLADGGVRVGASIPTPYGPVEKVVTLTRDGALELDVTLRWEAIPPGSLRLGHVTLHPEAFDRDSLFYASHDGGRALDVLRLGEAAVDHGRATSSLVTSSQGLGITEGVVVLGDARRHVVVEIDRRVATPMGLITYRPVDGSFFLRLGLSLAEGDDTRRGPIARDVGSPQRLRLRLRAVEGAPPEPVV